MGFNVLIVDDSSSMRAVIKKTIRVSGFNVSEYWEAADGIEALNILRNEWVDLVLSDINMPHMNGVQLISEMKKDEILKSIPVVMVTTEGSEKIDGADSLVIATIYGSATLISDGSNWVIV